MYINKTFCLELKQSVALYVSEVSVCNSSPYTCSLKVMTVGIKILMLVQARSLISSGHLTVGSLVSFFLYQKPMSTNLRVSLCRFLRICVVNYVKGLSLMVNFSLQEILYCYGETVSTVGVIDKVFSYLDRTPKCKKEGELAPEKLEGRIAFDKVTLSYASSADKAALKVTD